MDWHEGPDRLCSPEPAFFNAALKNTALKALTEVGHEVTVSDLYAMRWHRDLAREEYLAEKDSGSFFRSRRRAGEGVARPYPGT